MTAAAPVCEVCGALAFEARVPCAAAVDDGRVAEVCWHCAHMLSEHEVPLAELRAFIHEAPLDAPAPVHWHGAPRDGSARWCTCTALEIYPPGTAPGDRLRRERDEQAAIARVEDAVAAGKRIQPISGHVRADGHEVAPFFRCDPVRRRS